MMVSRAVKVRKSSQTLLPLLHSPHPLLHGAHREAPALVLGQVGQEGVDELGFARVGHSGDDGEFARDDLWRAAFVFLRECGECETVTERCDASERRKAPEARAAPHLRQTLRRTKRTLYRSSSALHPVDTPVTSVCWSTHEEMISLLKSLKL